MKKLRHLLIAIAIGFSVPCYAAEVIVGSISCKEWTSDRASDSSYINKSVDQNWVLGFLNGYSTTTGINFLAGVKTQIIFNWMDKYCINHPLKSIDDGATILAHELSLRMKIQ